MVSVLLACGAIAGRRSIYTRRHLVSARPATRGGAPVAEHRSPKRPHRRAPFFLVTSYKIEPEGTIAVTDRVFKAAEIARDRRNDLASLFDGSRRKGSSRPAFFASQRICNPDAMSN